MKLPALLAPMCPRYLCLRRHTRHCIDSLGQGSNFIAAIAAIAVEREQNAVDHCGNDGNFLPYSAIFILFRC